MKYILPVIIFKVKINNTGKIQISPNKMITILNSSFKKKWCCLQEIINLIFVRLLNICFQIEVIIILNIIIWMK